MTSIFARILGVAAVSTTTLVLASSALADVAPPDDQKSVQYSFKVTGLTAADRVVFAYPCGTSDGAPKDELRVLENDKPIGVGRRGGSCTLYSIAKTAYDDFAKTYTPSGSGGTDPKLAAFAGTALKCSGAPSPVFVIPKTDSRSAILEELQVTGLDATKCTVVAKAATSSSTSSGTPGTSPGTTSSSSGCTAGATGAAAPWLVALAVPFIVLGSRRRRRQG